ncbi:MAG: sulfur carrier protein ThiS adenylyltransferase ThiF [Bacteroidales bacterium]|nr:sulfur carrier protein ThiS adenylyltransferase ThiF [Bacteroidales bacterium]
MTFDEIERILGQKTVGIAGAGGLGSNCAAALARVGVGKLVVADFDIVSKDNLNRQYYFRNQIGQRKVDALKDNIRAINPSVRVEIHPLRLDRGKILEIFGECDVLVEAFDDAAMKRMIIESALEGFPGKPVVTGIGMAGWGDSNRLRMHRHEDLYVCGDQASEVSRENPPLAPRVGIVAHIQANTVLEILLRQTVGR